MLETVERTVISKDWLTLLFFFSFCLLVVIRFVFHKQFTLFLTFPLSQKYRIQYYAKQDHVLNWFSASLFIIQVISLSIFTYMAAIFWFPSLQNAPFIFVKIISFITVFIISKYLIEKMIAVIMDIEVYINDYNFHKITARNLFALCLLPVNLVIVYMLSDEKIIFFSVIGAFFLYNLIGLFFLLKNHQKLIISQLFYFILYLCALEIAPYLIVYTMLIE